MLSLVRVLNVTVIATAVVGCSGPMPSLSIEDIVGVGCSEAVIPEYERASWGRWTDEDGDCQDARQEVLIRDSRTPVELDDRGCKVVSGEWVDPYDGRLVSEPSGIDIDHVVALRDAHDSGGWQWGPEKKKTFSNDMRNLKASSRSTNRSKGARGPDEWLPSDPAARCPYIEEWLVLKRTFALSLSPGEKAVTDYMKRVCDRGKVPPLPQR